MSFTRIVKNYGYIHKLGKQIIEHKDSIKKVPPAKIDIEFLKQEDRIQKFVTELNKANKEWKSNETSINTYWTGY